jgi:hypothetical protein
MHAKEEAAIREGGATVYTVAEVVTKQDAKAATEAATTERRKKQDDTLQRCFAELLCMFPNAQAMLEAYRSSLISR